MNPKMCHHLIKDTAEGIAGEVYEMWAKKHDKWYKNNPDQKKYIKKNWPRFIEQARVSLTMCLNSPNLNEDQKERIADALIKDNQVRGRRPAQIAVH